MSREGIRDQRPLSQGDATAEASAQGAGRLLLAPGLMPEDVAALLRPYGFADLKRADGNLQAMAGEPRPRRLLAELVDELLQAVSETADPDHALNHWEHYLREGVNRAQLFEYLRGSPRMLHLLCSVFGNSPAMAQTLIRDPILIYWLAEEQVLTRRPGKAELERALNRIISNLATAEQKLEALRRFRRREMLRIGVRDLLRLSDVRETTAALTDLAVVLIEGANGITRADLQARYGAPRHRERAGKCVETGFAVIAMGKLGGGELNFSSDVDLIYVYESDEGRTSGGARRHASDINAIPNEEYFEYRARDLTRALADVTQEGYIFRVDLRLRAEGGVGRLARSIDDYRRYYRTRGQGWERMALLKAWPVAGSISVGKKFLRMAKPFIFMSRREMRREGGPKRFLDEVRAVKRMIDGKMAERQQEQRNVKLGIGGIRELEFVVQTIQVLFGSEIPELCNRSTLKALARFARCGLLSAPEREALVQSYLFLRDVEHKLQMVYDLQTHAIPEDEGELTRCAIRLGYVGSDRSACREAFLAEYRDHRAQVHQVFQTLVETPDRSALMASALKRVGRRRGRSSPSAPSG